MKTAADIDSSDVAVAIYIKHIVDMLNGVVKAAAHDDITVDYKFVETDESIDGRQNPQLVAIISKEII